jgi:hypothetical protein
MQPFGGCVGFVGCVGCVRALPLRRRSLARLKRRQFGGVGGWGLRRFGGVIGGGGGLRRFGGGIGGGGGLTTNRPLYTQPPTNLTILRILRQSITHSSIVLSRKAGSVIF